MKLTWQFCGHRGTPGQRCLSTELGRFLAEEPTVAFVAGPRQVGKSTLARRLLAEAGGEGRYPNWDIESQRKMFIRQPADF